MLHKFVIMTFIQPASIQLWFCVVGLNSSQASQLMITRICAKLVFQTLCDILSQMGEPYIIVYVHNGVGILSIMLTNLSLSLFTQELYASVLQERYFHCMFL